MCTEIEVKMSCFGTETRPFPRFFLLLGAVRVTDMEIRMSPNSGMKLTDMGDSRSGRLDVLTICKMRRADYEISSNNMWTYRP